MSLENVTITRCKYICSSRKKGKRGFRITYDTNTNEVEGYICLLGEDCLMPEMYSMAHKGEATRNLIKRITNESGI